MDPVLEWRPGKERAGLSNSVDSSPLEGWGQSAENLGFPVRFSIFPERQEPEQGLKLRTVNYFFLLPALSIFEVPLWF